MKLPVAVVDEESANPRVVKRFASVAQAEAWIASLKSLPNKKKVERGGYGIDAPEEMVNGE